MIDIQKILALNCGRRLEINGTLLSIFEITDAIEENVTEIALRDKESNEYLLIIRDEKEVTFLKIKRKTDLPFYADPLSYEKEEIQIKNLKILK